MTNQATTPMLCSIEIEDNEGVRTCDRTAVWSCRCSVRGGPLGPSAYRCDEHVGGTMAWWLEERNVTSISVVRQAGQ